MELQRKMDERLKGIATAKPPCIRPSAFRTFAVTSGACTREFNNRKQTSLRGEINLNNPTKCPRGADLLAFTFRNDPKLFKIENTEAQDRSEKICSESAFVSMKHTAEYPNPRQEDVCHALLPEDQESTRKCSTIQLTNSLAKATAQADAFARELVKRQEEIELKAVESETHVKDLEKYLEEAKTRIIELNQVEKEYVNFRGNIGKEVESLKENIDELKEKWSDSIQDLKLCKSSLEYYKRKCELLEEMKKDEDA